MAQSAVLSAEFASLQWTPVVSSNIKAVAFVPGLRLWVEFHRDPDSNSPGYRFYAYDHVPQAVYDALLAAPSKGKYHAKHIKWVYAYRPFA